MTLVNNNNKYNKYIECNSNDPTLKSCFVCFDDKNSYGICRHCLLGVCKHEDCVYIFPHIDNTEYLICTDCKHTIERKLKPVEINKEDEKKEINEKQTSLKLLQEAEEEKSIYENVLHQIRILQIF